MGYVYFIEAIGMNVFKIGKARVLPKRFADLDTASPCELRIFGVIKSDDYNALENKIHLRFKRFRIKKNNGKWKEWFRANKNEIVNVINKHKGFSLAEAEKEILIVPVLPMANKRVQLPVAPVKNFPQKEFYFFAVSFMTFVIIGILMFLDVISVEAGTILMFMPVPTTLWNVAKLYYFLFTQ